jgi:hypothetical protein
MRLISGVAHIFMPRALRKNLLERLRIPWRLPAGVIFTLPVPVRRKRFLTLLFVFNLGILSLFIKKLNSQSQGMPGQNS